MTRVVNIKFDSCDVYVGRNGSYKDHVSRCSLCQRRPLNLCSEGLKLLWFGNPYEIGKDGVRGSTISLYESYLRDRISRDKVFRNRVKKLHGRILGCWCKRRDPVLPGDEMDIPCHGDVLAKVAEELNLHSA
jgi:hypothetical protein